MAHELCQTDRTRIQLAISNPPHVRFQDVWKVSKRVPAGMPALPWMPFSSKTSTLGADGVGAPLKQAPATQPQQSKRGRSPPEVRSALRRAATAEALADLE